jgi:hypothetical protein
VTVTLLVVLCIYGSGHEGPCVTLDGRWDHEILEDHGWVHVPASELAS